MSKGLYEACIGSLLTYNCVICGDFPRLPLILALGAGVVLRQPSRVFRSGVRELPNFKYRSCPWSLLSACAARSVVSCLKCMNSIFVTLLAIYSIRYPALLRVNRADSVYLSYSSSFKLVCVYFFVQFISLFPSTTNLQLLKGAPLYIWTEKYIFNALVPF